MASCLSKANKHMHAATCEARSVWCLFQIHQNGLKHRTTSCHAICCYEQGCVAYIAYWHDGKHGLSRLKPTSNMHQTRVVSITCSTQSLLRFAFMCNVLGNQLGPNRQCCVHANSFSQSASKQLELASVLPIHQSA